MIARVRLSIVVPALDSAKFLPACLDALAPASAAERILVDGGSQDGTPALAQARGWRVIEAPRGRGPQLAAGAAAATGDWLLFVHADTVLAPGWAAAVAGFVHAPENADRAAHFRLAFDSPDPRARRVERLANWRARTFGLPYGDQALLIARAHYAALGGYRPLALMEDVDLVRRIGRARLRALDAAAVTSAARYERDGWRARPLRNLACLALWFAGVSPDAIRRLYR
ncbi:MAG: TIGR04283 family arsenosugar biosynthesis glycosyltransferase [Magnetospirillum sp.]|nr:TIGR04283 family arsenosugar biosynthesis glycosyltransferase [Magnetospirillum sp.]